MDSLPDELLLHVFSYLDHRDLVTCQSLSLRLKLLARDPNVWKEKCFEISPAESARRRQQRFDDTNDRLAALRNAVSSLPAEFRLQYSAATAGTSRSKERRRALANWDPTYPGEHPDFYQEYIHRYAPIAPIEWFPLPKDRGQHGSIEHEATGIGILPDSDGNVQHIINPLDDGSVCVWNTEQRSSDTSVHIVAQSHPGLLAGLSSQTDRRKIAAESATIMTEVGAVECVAIDSWNKRGYFAVQHDVREVDLSTLQLISTQSYPFPITTLSDIAPSLPLTVGTSHTIHLSDPRIPLPCPNPNYHSELIAGPLSTPAILTQPGPVSILHPSPSSIYIAGSFTHLLHYDRRLFPRLLNTLYSGARLSSLSVLSPSPAADPTLLAAGVYKGKGSLELHHPALHSRYTNRHSASASKLLHARPHGASVVACDADGAVVWLERSARFRVRSVNINTPPAGAAAARDDGEGDMVRKFHPLHAAGTTTTQGGARRGVANPLLLWTADGRVGALGFGRRAGVACAASAAEEEDDEEDSQGEMHDAASRAERVARREEEVRYAGSMRRALEGQAVEARFMRGLGLG